MKIIYLMCLHNSGSTIMALIANAHEEIVSPGEVVGPDKSHPDVRGPICSCGVHVYECSYWKAVSDTYMKNGHPWKPDEWGLDHEFHNNKLLSKLVFSRPDPHGTRFSLLKSFPVLGGTLRNIQSRNHDFYKAINNVSKREVIFDASKHPERLIYLSQIPELDISVVHMTRDPRGWCNSRRKNNKEDVAEAAKRWAWRNQFMEKVAERFPQQKRITMKYEDFCSGPQEAMTRITDLAGIEKFDFPQTLEGVEHHVLGNRMRTQKNVTVKMDISWQTELTDADKSVIESTTRSVANRFGYDF